VDTDAVSYKVAGQLGHQTRAGNFIAGDLSTVMSPRTVINSAHNAEIFRNIG
jgi:hypothetical protein